MVAITVVLAATIYVWVSGMGGGGGGTTVSMTLKQQYHGYCYNGTWQGSWPSGYNTSGLPDSNNSGIVIYQIQSVNGNPGWEDLSVKIAGQTATVYKWDPSTTQWKSSSSGKVNAGDVVAFVGGSYTDINGIVGDTVTITHTPSGSMIFSTPVTYA